MSSWSRQIPFLNVLYGAAVGYDILLTEAGGDSHATLFADSIWTQMRWGLKSARQRWSEDKSCSADPGARLLYLYRGWTLMIVKDFGSDCLLWFSVSSSDIRVNDILDRLLAGGLCGWRTHLGFNKLPSPEGVPVSPPLLCKLRKHFFSHLQGAGRERKREREGDEVCRKHFSFF